MKLMRIEAGDAQRTPVEFCDAEVADSLFSRFVGLQFRASLPPGRGLLLVPCNHIHTVCLRFALDIIRIDKSGQVLCVDPYVEPWSFSRGPRETHAVLEVPGATARIHPGDWLRVADPASAPESLRFLTGAVPALASVSASSSKPDSSDSSESSAASVKSATWSKAPSDSASKGHDAASVDEVSQKVIHV